MKLDPSVHAVGTAHQLQYLHQVTGPSMCAMWQRRLEEMGIYFGVWWTDRAHLCWPIPAGTGL